MKMKELEDRTGIGREAIRYYIREGLLPEPEKPKRNVAIYSEEHVSRINLIRKLQEERYLPLSTIRSLVDDIKNEKSASWNLLGLEFQLASRLGANTLKSKLVADLLSETNVGQEDLHILQSEGIIEVLDEPGGPSLSGQDARIIQLWNEIQNFGFSKDLGYTARDLKRYQTAAQDIADEEVDTFFERISGTRSTEDAAALAETGLSLVEQIFSILHSRAVLRNMAKRNADRAEND
jgi:DNA-binding transcriptional MerR regulator